MGYSTGRSLVGLLCLSVRSTPTGPWGQRHLPVSESVTVPVVVRNDRRFVTKSLNYLCHKSLMSQSMDDMSQKKLRQIVQVLQQIMTNGPYILVHIAPFCEISSKTNTTCDKPSVTYVTISGRYVSKRERRAGSLHSCNASYTNMLQQLL